MTESDFAGLPLAARCTIALVCAAGLIATLCSIAFQPTLASGRLFLLLALAAGTACRKVNLFKGSSLSFLTSVVLVAVIKEGPAVAVAVAVLGVTVQTVFPSRKIVLHQLAFNAGMIAFTVTASWFTYHAIAAIQPVNAIAPETTAALVSSFTYFLGNSISVSLIVALTRGMSLIQIWLHHFLVTAPSFMIAGLFSVACLALLTTTSFFLIAVLVTAIAVAYYCSIRSAAQSA